MRSGTNHTITSREVYQWAVDRLVEAKLIADHGWLCTAAVVWSFILILVLDFLIVRVTFGTD